MKISEFVKDIKLAPEDVPKVLLPYQARWVADKRGIKLCSKTRRAGLSWTEAGDCALEASKTKGEDSFYIGYEKDMARCFIEDAADWAKAYKLVASEIDESEEIFRDGEEDKSIFVFRIHFNSGYKIEALSSKPRNLRSRQGRVVIDEAAWHDDFKGLFDAAKALRLMGSPIHIITTYNGMDEPYYELEKDVLAGKLPYGRHLITFDDALSDGLYRRFCLIKGWEWSPEIQAEWRNQTMKEFSDAADQELLCIPSRSGGAYFSRVLVENCMIGDIPVIKLELPDSFAIRPEKEREAEVDDWLVQNLAPLLEDLDPNLKTFYGMDFGRSGDLSALLPLQQLPNLVRRAMFALELRNIPFEQQKQILFFVVDRLLQKSRFQGGAMDGRGNGQFLSEVAWQRYGKHRIAQIMFTEAWYGEHFPKYKAGLEDKKILLAADDNWLQDHRDVVMVKGIPKIKEKRTKGTDGKQRHGDGAIAAVLAWFASCQEYGAGVFAPDFGLLGGEVADEIDAASDWFT